MKLLSKKGFSLIEMIIVTGIMGAGALALLHMQKNNTMSFKTHQSNNDILYAVGEIRSLLSSPSACQKTFIGFNAKGPSVIQKILNPNGQTKFNLINNINNSLKIDSMELSDLFPGVTVNTGVEGDTYLLIKFNKGSHTYGNLVTKKIKLWVKTDGANLIEGCRAFSSGTSNIWERSSVDQKNIFYNDGKVGIGTDTALAQLHNTGDSLFDGEVNAKGGVIVGNSVNCTPGMIRFNSIENALEFCDNFKKWINAGVNILSQGNFRKNYNIKANVSYTKVINIARRGVITLSASIRRNYNGPIMKYSGAKLVLEIDGVPCGYDYTLFRDLTNVSFDASSSCSKALKKGNHTLRVYNLFTGDTLATFARASFLSWVVHAY